MLFFFVSELMDLLSTGKEQSADQPNNLAEGRPSVNLNQTSGLLQLLVISLVYTYFDTSGCQDYD